MPRDECDTVCQVSDTGGFRELGENVIQVAEPTTLYGACNGVKVTCVDVSGQRTRHVVENYKRIYTFKNTFVIALAANEPFERSIPF